MIFSYLLFYIIPKMPNIIKFIIIFKVIYHKIMLTVFQLNN